MNTKLRIHIKIRFIRYNMIQILKMHSDQANANGHLVQGELAEELLRQLSDHALIKLCTNGSIIHWVSIPVNSNLR